MSSGEVDSREVQIDISWLQDDLSGSEQDEDVDEEMADEDVVDAAAIDDDPLDSDSDLNEEEDEDEIPAPAPSSKRKRSGASSAQPNKRVSFAAGTATKEPKSSRIKTSKPKSSPKGFPKRHSKAKKV